MNIKGMNPKDKPDNVTIRKFLEITNKVSNELNYGEIWEILEIYIKVLNRVIKGKRVCKSISSYHFIAPHIVRQYLIPTIRQLPTARPKANSTVGRT